MSHCFCGCFVVPYLTRLPDVYFNILTSFQKDQLVFDWFLTHWGRLTHICLGNLTIIGSDNGLSPGRRQAIIWTNAGILLIGTLGTNFNEISIEIQIFSFKKMHFKMSSAKWRPFCLGLNVLMIWTKVLTMILIFWLILYIWECSEYELSILIFYVQKCSYKRNHTTGLDARASKVECPAQFVSHYCGIVFIEHVAIIR